MRQRAAMLHRPETMQSCNGEYTPIFVDVKYFLVYLVGSAGRRVAAGAVPPKRCSSSAYRRGLMAGSVAGLAAWRGAGRGRLACWCVGRAAMIPRDAALVPLAPRGQIARSSRPPARQCATSEHVLTILSMRANGRLLQAYSVPLSGIVRRVPAGGAGRHRLGPSTIFIFSPTPVEYSACRSPSARSKRSSRGSSRG